jgi:glutamate synthase domain-containing protein 1
MVMGDQMDMDKAGGMMQNMEAQYHKEARKREIERLKREFMDLKAKVFKKKKEEKKVEEEKKGEEEDS